MTSDIDLQELAARLQQATGSDPALDAALAETLGAAPGSFSASVEGATALLGEVLPAWHWHVGWDASGLLPYARLKCGNAEVQARAPTVPLAILRAALQALELAAAQGQPSQPTISTPAKK